MARKRRKKATSDPRPRESTPAAAAVAEAPAPLAPAQRVVKETARGQFEKWALTYDRSWLNELVFYPSIRACLTEIAAWKAKRGTRPYRVLDVGCGTGTFLSLAAQDMAATHLVGLDYAAEMVRRAAEKFSNLPTPERMLAVRADAERLPFADGAFEVVTCCNSFHHYPHQPAAVAEFRRVLAPGGMLVLIDGFRDNVIGWVVFDVAVTSIERNVHHAAWSRVRSLLTDAGFRGVRQRKMNVLAPLLVTIATT